MNIRPVEAELFHAGGWKERWRNWQSPVAILERA